MDGSLTAEVARDASGLPAGYEMDAEAVDGDVAVAILIRGEDVRVVDLQRAPDGRWESTDLDGRRDVFQSFGNMADEPVALLRARFNGRDEIHIPVSGRRWWVFVAKVPGDRDAYRLDLLNYA